MFAIVRTCLAKAACRCGAFTASLHTLLTIARFRVLLAKGHLSSDWSDWLRIIIPLHCPDSKLNCSSPPSATRLRTTRLIMSVPYSRAALITRFSPAVSQRTVRRFTFFCLATKQYTEMSLKLHAAAEMVILNGRSVCPSD